MFRSLALTLPLAIAFAATPLSITIAAPDQVAISAAKKKKQNQVRRPGYEQHIACTPGGCFPTPPGCVPSRAMDWRGNPYEYDVVVCRR